MEVRFVFFFAYVIGATLYYLVEKPGYKIGNKLVSRLNKLKNYIGSRIYLKLNDDNTVENKA